MQVTVFPEWTKVIAFFIPCKWAREPNKNDELIKDFDPIKEVSTFDLLIILIS